MACPRSTPKTWPTLRAAAPRRHYQNTMELVTHHWERRSRQFVTLVAVLAGRPRSHSRDRLIAPALEAFFSSSFPCRVRRRIAPQGADAGCGRPDPGVPGGHGFLSHGQPGQSDRASSRPTISISSTSKPRSGRNCRSVPINSRSHSEGEFYKAAGPDTSRLIRRCYKAVLGFLLLFFFAARLYFDYPRGRAVASELADQAVFLTWVRQELPVRHRRPGRHADYQVVREVRRASP